MSVQDPGGSSRDGRNLPRGR